MNRIGRSKNSKCQSVESDITKELDTNNYHTFMEIKDMILKKFDINLSLTATKNLIKRLGFRRLKPASLPAKADTEKQYKFYNDTLKTLMDKALKKEVILLFLDASHFVFGGDYNGAVYSRKRRLVKTFSGRQRFNVLGAIDFRTKKILNVTNTTYINADSLIKMLEMIKTKYKYKPVYIILDNARYQRCSKVQQKAEELNINLVFIPPYSPNLNLIERYWRFVKSELRKQSYSDFKSFREFIEAILKDEDKKYTSKVKSLISNKIQFFDDYNDEPDLAVA